jgi:hypothetical protein
VLHAGIHLFGGDLDLHRSRIDSVTGSGIHVDFQARLLMDSTRIVGSGGEGLLVASPIAGLSTTEFNKFIGNAVASVRLRAAAARLQAASSIAATARAVRRSIVVEGAWWTARQQFRCSHRTRPTWCSASRWSMRR